MTTRIAKRPKTGPRVQVIDGRRVVLLDEQEYDRLKQKADEWEPLLPEPDAEGNYPALEYARASLALKIVRHRRRVGLSQAELARRASIRPETLNRIEQGRNVPSLPTIEKIDRVLKEAEAADAGNGRTQGKKRK